MTDLKVVQLRAAPSLMDVVGQIRKFANDVESGKYGEVHDVTVLLRNVDDDEIHIFGWGQAATTSDQLVGLLFTAATVAAR